MYGNVFVRRTGRETLDEFAAAVFALLGVTRIEKRSSSNYLDETYYVGTALAIDLTVALADDERFQDYEFWLSLKRNGPRGEDDSYLDQCGDVIARVLAMSDYEVCRALNWERPGSKRARYLKRVRTGEATVVETCIEEL
jgi:hypothetical protein